MTRGDVPTSDLELLEMPARVRLPEKWNVGAHGIILPWEENMERQAWNFSLMFSLEKGRIQGNSST